MRRILLTKKNSDLSLGSSDVGIPNVVFGTRSSKLLRTTRAGQNKNWLVLPIPKVKHRSTACVNTVDHLHDRPSAREVNFVDTKFLLAISKADRGINIVIIKDGAQAGVAEDTLSTGAIDIAVAREHIGATAIDATNTALVRKGTRRA
jgi:hypothetical protein